MDTFEESVARILDCMAQAGRKQRRSAQFVIGKVLEAGSGVLRVSADGQELKEEDLWVNEALLPGYCPQLTATLPGTGYHGPCTTLVKEFQLTRGKHALAEGDRVVLLTEDKQDYYLIAKAVRL